LIHSSCRNGLDKPPPTPKKKASNTKGDDARSTHSASTQVIKPISLSKSKAKPTRPDPRLGQLESMHEKSNVSLHLPEGTRIKLPRSLPKGRIAANFDLQLSDITDPVDSRTHVNIDDDDLPEPFELLNEIRSNKVESKAGPPPETNYSNSEIDALIRNAPLDKEDNSPVFPKSPDFTDSFPTCRPISSPRTHSLKRRLLADENQPISPSPAKRNKSKVFGHNHIDVHSSRSASMVCCSFLRLFSWAKYS
jgi:hypothetical protein